ncbi:MAG: hypothetical protein AAB973_00265 [Patescibacteria group bacterium]|mgnify:CR=1 FL=1
MKKSLLFLLLTFGLLLLTPKVTLAAEPKCWCVGADANCTLRSPSCPSGDAQDYEGFSVCCNEPNLYNSVFALKSPICGSSLEKSIIGCENGTFADGNTMLFCVGNEFRRGETNSIFDGKDNVNFDPGGSFTYNGNNYSSGNVYVCNSAASCCAQGGAGFKCEDIYKPNPSNPPAIDDNNALPNDKRASLCGLTGEPDDDLVRYVHTNIDQYELTCADTPVVDVVRSTCSTDAGGEGAPYGKVTQYDNNGKVDPFDNGGQEFIDVQAIVSLASAKLGGYGPDPTAQRNNSLDALAKVYPYNAFLNQALQTNAPREASGTFWRLLNQLDQMNAKAKLMIRFRQNTPPMRDQDIVYAGDEASQEGDADGRALADYMNAIIDGVGGNSKIKLLSPAFNITSHFTPPLIAKMLSAGANFSALAGCAGNTYTVAGQGAYSWYKSFLAQTGLSGKCNFVFTEFGDFDTFGKPLDGRPDVINRMKDEFNKTVADSSVMGALYFNAMGGNDDFDGHELSQAEYSTITSSNPAKAGVNSAKPFDGGTFQDAAASYAGSGWTLEIAFSSGDEGTVVNSINRALSRGLTPIIRICVGNTCDFADPKAYVEFLQKVASQTTGAFYAIAGPNEPEREQWVGTTPNDIPTPPPKTTKLSSLMGSLPGCLTSYPVCKDAIGVYAALDPDTRIKYDALIPFNQDNLRGYLGLRYIEPVDRQTDVGILTEGLPYIQSIKEALNDPSFGIVNALSPGWLNAARVNQSTSENYITPQQEKNNRGVIERVADKVKQIWGSDTKEDDPERNQLGCYLHEKGTTLPAPTTYPKDFPVSPSKSEWEIQSEPFSKSLYQFIRVPVETKETPNSEKCIIRNKFGVEIGRGTHYVTTVLKGPGSRPENSYIVSNIGRSIAVLNNPKMTDISTLISEPKNNANYSLTAMMLPDFAELSGDYKNTPLLAPGASYDSTIYVYTDPATQDSATAGKSQSTSGLIARKGGQAHIDLCKLRNFWFRPAGMQLGKPEDCENLDSYIKTTTSTSPYLASTTSTNPAGQCTIPTDSYDSTVRAAIQKMHDIPGSNANKVPLQFLFAVYEIESFPYFTGAQPYVCQENPVTAAGPFQIVKNTYDLLTCESERLGNDLAVCSSSSGKLSRCDVDNSVELAARVILFSAGKWIYGPGNCSATGSISSTDKATIYKAANNYYGSCQPDAGTSAYKLQIPRPNSGRPNYGDIVLEKMGLIKTASDYPQPQCK